MSSLVSMDSAIFAVTPNDDVKFSPINSLIVGTPGNVTIKHADGTIVTLVDVNGQIFVPDIVAVLATGTGASNIVAIRAKALR